MTQTLTIDIWSDVMCPWCLVGWGNLRKALDTLQGEIEADIRWHAFELNPDMPQDGEERTAHIARKYGTTTEQSKAVQGRMREAAEKRVVVEDVDLVTFQALLKFVYSDDLRHVEEWTESAIAESEGDAPPQRKRIAVLQRMLAARHKYQLARLRLWCEQQLCECIDVDGACDVLRQAHLYEAKQLEAACLEFV